MPGNNWELLQNPSPNSPFGAQYGAAGLALPDPSGRPPPTEDQLTNAGVKALETSSVPITLGGRYPTPGQPIPVPGAPGMPAPLPEVSLQGGNPNAAGPLSRGMGIGLKLPSSVDEINAHMEGAQPWLTKVNGVSRPNERLGNEGLNLMHDANAEGAAAQRATAGVAEKGAEELSKISGERQDLRGRGSHRENSKRKPRQGNRRDKDQNERGQRMDPHAFARGPIPHVHDECGLGNSRAFGNGPHGGRRVRRPR